MDENSITAQILEYLLKHRFGSKAEMARALGMQPRTLEKVFANLEVAKGASIALIKALDYCLQCEIPLDPIFQSLLCDGQVAEIPEKDVAMAYNRLMMNEPQHLTADGERIFVSMQRFLRLASAQVCPQCKTWCNPWSGKHDAAMLDCCIGHMAREIVRDVAEFYTQEGDDE